MSNLAIAFISIAAACVLFFLFIVPMLLTKEDSTKW